MKYRTVLDDRSEALSAGDLVVNIEKAGSVSSKVYSPTGSVQNAQNTFILDQTSRRTGRVPRILANVEGTLTITGVNLQDGTTAGNLNMGNGWIGFRPMPLNSVISVEHKIGNANLSTQNYLFSDVLSNVNFTPKEYLDMPNIRPDEYAAYNPIGSTLSNPFGNYSNCLPNAFKPRTSGLNVVAASCSATKIVLNFKFSEPLYTGFTDIEMREQPAIFNINGETITINIQNNAQRMFCFVPGAFGNANNAPAAITSYAVAFTSMTLACEYVTIDHDCPDTYSYCFKSYNVQTKALNKTATEPGTAITQSNTLTTTVSPQKIYACIRESPTTYNAEGYAYQAASTHAARFVSVSKCQVQYGTNPYMLSSYNNRQLYEMSVKNGYTGTFESWSGANLSNISLSVTANNQNMFGAGSLLVIDPVLDCGINSLGLSNNCAVNTTITVELTGENQQTLGAASTTSPTFENPQHVVIFETLNELVRVNGEFSVLPFIVQESDVHKALKDNHDAYVSEVYHGRNPGHMNGGSFWGSLWKGIKKVAKGVGNFAVDHADDIGKIALGVAKKAVGAGMKKPSNKAAIKTYN